MGESNGNGYRGQSIEQLLDALQAALGRSNVSVDSRVEVSPPVEVPAIQPRSRPEQSPVREPVRVRELKREPIREAMHDLSAQALVVYLPTHSDPRTYLSESFGEGTVNDIDYELGFFRVAPTTISDSQLQEVYQTADLVLAMGRNEKAYVSETRYGTLLSIGKRLLLPGRFNVSAADNAVVRLDGLNGKSSAFAHKWSSEARVRGVFFPHYVNHEPVLISRAAEVESGPVRDLLCEFTPDVTHLLTGNLGSRGAPLSQVYTNLAPQNPNV